MKLKLFGLPALLSLLIACALTQSFTTNAWADEDEITKEETAANDVADKPDWQVAVKEKYGLTDEQVQKMRDAGLKGPGMAITAEFAKLSGKTIDEVTKMRTEEKMGWGQIAQKLSLPPGTIGQSVAGLHKEVREKRFERREEKREKREEKRQERKAKQAERKAEREARKAERKEKRAEK